MRHRVSAILIGWLVHFLVMSPLPCPAQFAVHDWKSYLLQVQKKLDDAKKWVEQYNKYVQLVQQGSHLVTNTRGVLSLAELAASKDDNKRKTYADIGRLVTSTFSLKRQLERSLFNTVNGYDTIKRRLRAGIFNPEQNLRDLEVYITQDMGRICQDKQANLDRIAEADPELRRLLDSLQEVYVQISVSEKLYNEAQTKLAIETLKNVFSKAPPDPSIIDQLSKQMADALQNVGRLNAQERELLDKIEARCKQLHVTFGERTAFARQTLEDRAAWERFSEINEKAVLSLDSYGYDHVDQDRPE